MKITATLYAATRKEWREWLEANHEREREIWLVSYRKATGRPSVPYNDAVEEALCFEWIDSTRKRIDEDRFAQRYTPRREKSPYSQLNKERLAHLILAGRVAPSVLKKVRDVRVDYEIPPDILSALKSDEKAWEFFRSTSPSYQRIRAAFVDTARQRPEEFEKRLRHLVAKSAQGRQFGYGIEDYY
jgi:uncharacterized protein YdeI (YjbR/CyaY-like superfamily)